MGAQSGGAIGVSSTLRSSPLPQADLLSPVMNRTNGSAQAFGNFARTNTAIHRSKQLVLIAPPRLAWNSSDWPGQAEGPPPHVHGTLRRPSTGDFKSRLHGLAAMFRREKLGQKGEPCPKCGKEKVYFVQHTH